MSNIFELRPAHERWTIMVNEDVGEEFVEYIPANMRKRAGIFINAKTIERVPYLIEQGKRLLAREVPSGLRQMGGDHGRSN